MARALGLRRVSVVQRFVPSSEGQVRAALAGWGASVVPLLQVQGLLERGELVNIALQTSRPVNLYWHCWNLDSLVIDRLTQALQDSAKGLLGDPRKIPAAKLHP